jgi:hypothetical protein
MNTEKATVEKVKRYAVTGASELGALLWIWPFHSVPTGSHGPVTQCGRVIGIQPVGVSLTVRYGMAGRAYQGHSVKGCRCG